MSIELLDDSAFDLEEYIAREFAYAFGAAEEQAFCVGTGTGQPTGLFTANGGTVGVTAASATAVTTDEVISLIYALKAPYRKNAKFLMNDATVSALRKLMLPDNQIAKVQLRVMLGGTVFATDSIPVPTKELLHREELLAAAH